MDGDNDDMRDEWSKGDQYKRTLNCSNYFGKFGRTKHCQVDIKQTLFILTIYIITSSNMSIHKVIYMYMYILPCELLTGRYTDVSSNDSSPCNHDIVSFIDIIVSVTIYN